jgi:transposase
VELLPWAEPHQRQTSRLQQQLALEAASMPVMHVATLHGLSWTTVWRAEQAALQRWAERRESAPLQMVGIDEKYLGRRGKYVERYVTIISNLETGEPLWIGRGRSEATVTKWLATLTKEQKAQLKLVATDMHQAFINAIKADKDLSHVVYVHDPFHVMKRAGEAITELRREVFFRAGDEMRRLGRGTRWLVLRAWERCNEEQRTMLRRLFSLNGKLARAYQLVEELREALRAPDGASLRAGLMRILRRTERRDNKPMRKWHDSIEAHWNEIVAFGDHRPPTGRIEALNNNWETLVRRARGYRNLGYLLLKLRFMTINPIHTKWDIERFLALGVEPPLRRVA